MKKCLLVFPIVMVASLFTFSNEASADQFTPAVLDSNGMVVEEVNESDIILYNEQDDISLPQEEVFDPIGSMLRYPLSIRKVNVSTRNEWSGYKRVSDNVATTSKGGSITATTVATFGVSISGNIQGINVSTTGSVSSSRGYSLNIGPNKRVYLGYRVLYSVEEGTREVYRTSGGKVESRNKYTVKRPKYGEYKLINY